MSHQDDILAVLKTLDEGWHDTKEIHDALGDYWTEQRVSDYVGKTLQYTNHSLSRLEKRGAVEKKRVEGFKCAFWRVVE